MLCYKVLNNDMRKKHNDVNKDNRNYNSVYMRYNLQFFAEGEGGEKTEEATAKKLEKAREERARNKQAKAAYRVEL